MIDFIELDKKIKKKEIDNCIIFCSFDEKLIRDSIKAIEKQYINEDFKQLNYVEIDGVETDSNTVLNCCETLPVLSEKRMVVIYRSEFLRGGSVKKGENEEQDENTENTDDKSEPNINGDMYKFISAYAEKIPKCCILLMYYVLKDKREKISNRVTKLDKKVSIVKDEKQNKLVFEKRVKDVFQDKGKDIGNLELKLFCNVVSTNMAIAENEIEKLCCYVDDRNITRNDIEIMFHRTEDDDIFNMVDYLSQKRPEKAIQILNKLTNEGGKIPLILYMIERQYKLLIKIKLELQAGNGKNYITSYLKLNPYICEKMIRQCEQFKLNKLMKNLEYCTDAEKRIKSISLNAKTEIEILIIKLM